MAYHPTEIALLVVSKPREARRQLRAALDTHPTIAEAAKALGITPRTLHRQIVRLKMKSGKPEGRRPREET